MTGHRTAGNISSESASGGRSGAAPKRILIVEDDAGIAKLLLDNLTIDGFAVKWASDAHQALVLCQEFLPDLVLLDIMLKGRSGLEIFGLLRQGGRRGVIILSARGQKRDKLA